MSKPYKYESDIDIISDGTHTLHVQKDMPEWVGKDLYEDVDFDFDIDNNGLGVANPIVKKLNPQL